MLSGNPTIFGIDPFSLSTTPKHPVGAKGVSPDGRTFRYAKAAATNIATGKLCVAADVTANHEDIAFAVAGAVGDQSINVTLGATAVAANEYDGGYVVIIDDTGEGHTHLITSHPASDGSEAVDIYIKPGLEEATTTSTTVTLVRNPYTNVVISATDQADIPLGVTPIAATASNYFWLQTGGIASCLSDESTAAGDVCTIGTGTAGAVEAADAANEPVVGIIPAGVAAEDGEHNPIYLTLDN